MIPFLDTTTNVGGFTCVTSTNSTGAFTVCAKVPFLWAASFNDFLLEVVLAFMVAGFIIMAGIYLFLRGEWGKEFWHSDKRDMAIEFQHEGSVKPFALEKFGALLKIKNGKDKGMVVIPRQNASFKSTNSPLIRLVLGRGIGTATNPFLAEYVRRLSGDWPAWSGSPPPKKIADLDSFYLTYANLKAKEERNVLTVSREKWVEERLNDVAPPEEIVMADDGGQQLQVWKAERKERLGYAYDRSGGSFGEMATQLSDPKISEQAKGVIHYFLNGAIQSEPVELWPTWIGGFQVDARDLARFAEPISAAELTNAMVKIENALKTSLNELMPVIKIVLIFFGIAVSFAIVYSVLTH